ncbi:MAG: peptidoglycan DD-metalloendopeptidase family protein [Gallionella sp.]|nr:peptidoglycan DD-metalloendopeptidase family protein [Gallionella sp.]
MLTQNLLSQERKMKLRLFVALSTIPLLGVVTAFGLVSESDLGLAKTNITVQEITLPEIAVAQISAASFWRNERVQRGDTLVALLSRLNITEAAAINYLIGAPEAAPFRTLAIGKEAQAETNANGDLISLRFLNTGNEQVLIDKQNGAFQTKTLTVQLEKRLFVRTGEIKTSLYAATDAAGMPESAADQLTQLFSGDIDFHHDVKPGDKFTVVYEMEYSNGALVNIGRIQAAEFINQGHSYRAVYFSKDGQTGSYYTPEGKNVEKAFLRSPIEYSRVSSGFTSARMHPVLNTLRAHKGVDFAAPTGTPIKATADGVIELVGRENGYGNVIKMNHQGRYSTVYGHLSRFASGLHNGQRVKQGQVIGYVGMTGLATGPHLHYEFKIDGQQRNPMSVALPSAQPVSTAYKTAFQSVAIDFVARLSLLRNTNLAKLD